MKKIVLMMTVILTTQIAYADSAKEESIKQLLDITHVKQLVDSIQTQMQPMFNNIIEKTVDHKDRIETSQLLMQKRNFLKFRK